MTPDLQAAFGDAPIPPLPEALDREVHDFFVAWLAWVDAGAPHREPFMRYDGLCVGALVYGGVQLRRKVSHLWRRTYPFGLVDYDTRAAACTQHECPRRLAWVRAALLLPIEGENA